LTALAGVVSGFALAVVLTMRCDALQSSNTGMAACTVNSAFTMMVPLSGSSG